MLVVAVVAPRAERMMGRGAEKVNKERQGGLTKYYVESCPRCVAFDH